MANSCDVGSRKYPLSVVNFFFWFKIFHDTRQREIKTKLVWNFLTPPPPPQKKKKKKNWTTKYPSHPSLSHRKDWEIYNQEGWVRSGDLTGQINLELSDGWGGESYNSPFHVGYKDLLKWHNDIQPSQWNASLPIALPLKVGRPIVSRQLYTNQPTVLCRVSFAGSFAWCIRE